MRFVAIGVVVSFIQATSPTAVAVSPTTKLRAKNVEALKAARIAVTHRALNGSDHAFEITAEVREGFTSLDAKLWVGSDKGLVAYTPWKSANGKCVAVFMVGDQALKDAQFTVVHRKDQFNPFERCPAYVLNLSEFASDAGNAKSAQEEAFPDQLEASAPIAKDGETVKVAIKHKEALSNWHYDVHITMTSGLDQHLEIRSGQPLTKKDIRLADLTADGFLDIMIVGGKDHRGEDWFRTLLYDTKDKKYKWINEP